jgi:hypothetical protein
MNREPDTRAPGRLRALSVFALTKLSHDPDDAPLNPLGHRLAPDVPSSGTWR